MKSKLELDQKKFLPADIDSILDNFGHLLTTYTNLSDRDSIFGQYKRSTKRLEVLFPLIEHKIHGKTGLHVIEIYDEAGYVKNYSYSWKIIVPKLGVQLNHISSWGNDAHNDPNTPNKFRVESEPHHHHHIPGNRSERTENWDVHTLHDAFHFIQHYLESGKKYKP
ncbi:DUF6516 family protein [Paenibacillus sp. JDR-2]|uniref:DUF6516 family protein n=1 Tax=Paenibacillus sp. (strain JDR-2) TaxID=324057 RepID=UPI0001663FC3|nr:DUF6516 family protein [Paenibacillus sp. JDR-2]ACT02927.1 hypothetical protein Pjdr2_4305 [Paenibacillus sp. JDR-2]